MKQLLFLNDINQLCIESLRWGNEPQDGKIQYGKNGGQEEDGKESK